LSNVSGQVLVIADNGKPLGTFDARTARQMAYEQGLDLICVQPNAPVPVCRIIDGGKWAYEKKKKERANRQHALEMKEFRFGVNIAQHDIDIKVGHIRELLDKGHPIKISVKMKGREVHHSDFAYNLVNNIAESLKECAKVDKISRADKQVFATVLPI
jgi:translation initiation factor IF-3